MQRRRRLKKNRPRVEIMILYVRNLVPKPDVRYGACSIGPTPYLSCMTRYVERVTPGTCRYSTCTARGFMGPLWLCPTGPRITPPQNRKGGNETKHEQTKMSTHRSLSSPLSWCKKTKRKTNCSICYLMQKSNRPKK